MIPRLPQELQEAPHLLVVGAGNSLDTGPVGHRQEAKREAQWRRRLPDQGGDRAPQLPLHVFCLHPRSDGTKIRKEGGAGSGALTNRGLKGARLSGVTAADRVRTEKRTGVCSRRHRCPRRHRTNRPGGRQGGVVPQEKDHNVVAEERSQGIASSLLEPSRRRLQIENRQYGVRELQPPRSSTPARSDEEIRHEYKTRTSSAEKEFKGESNANVADGGIGTQNFAGAGAENILQGDRDDLRRQRPQGQLRGAEEGFFLAVSPFT